MAMDEKDKKTGFWGGLLRGGSLAVRPKPSSGRQTRRVSESDASKARRRRRQDEDMRRRPKPRTKIEEDRDKADVNEQHSPLTEWPPIGMPPDKELIEETASKMIARGAPNFRGFKRPIAHAAEQYYALYATASGSRTDTASLTENTTQMMTFRLLGPGVATSPWSTLEQPSYAFMFGKRPGTITLNHWVSLASQLPATITLRDSGVVPRPMELWHLCERLKELQAGLEDDDEDLLYKILYKRIMRDPDRILNPHKTLDKQIMDLILALSRPDWIDFTDLRNQVATRFIFDPEYADTETYTKFFRQLLLSMELELRIHSKKHNDWAREKLVAQIPPTIQWNLALARRWREHVRIDEFGNSPSHVKLRYKLRKKQVKALKRFATTMKWPNLNDTLDNLDDKDEQFALDTISSDALAYFSGLILPGPTFPFLIMNTLIDLDPDEATDDLALLSHIHPSCGFQYRNSYTYWTASCIVGKVLAPTCRALAGWIGPARPTADLGRSQIARIRSRKPKQLPLRVEDVESMAERSDALGPPAEVYPVREYLLVGPEEDGLLDLARMELLTLKAVPGVNAGAGPGLYDAKLQFAIDGVSWPLHLTYDVSFISAWPCSDGPHVLFFDYIHKTVPVDDLIHVQDWGGLFKKPVLPQSARSTPVPDPLGRGTGGNPALDPAREDEHPEEEVLVVEAMGVKDYEVLARAWCAHWGLSAVVADINKTCMACAVRECYAGALTVLILVEDKVDERDDER